MSAHLHPGHCVALNFLTSGPQWAYWVLEVRPEIHNIVGNRSMFPRFPLLNYWGSCDVVGERCVSSVGMATLSSLFFQDDFSVLENVRAR